jgi:hypothetical protein
MEIFDSEAPSISEDAGVVLRDSTNTIHPS